MEGVVESIPSSLYGDLSKDLVGIVLGTQDKDIISTELAKNIIYLWRQDQLATPAGLSTLLKAAVKVDATKTYAALDNLGLNEVTVSLKGIQ